MKLGCWFWYVVLKGILEIKGLFGRIILIDWISVFWLIGVGSCLRFFFKKFWIGIVGFGGILGLNFKMSDIMINDFFL